MIKVIQKTDEDGVGSVSSLGGEGFGDGRPALTKGDYRLPGVLTKRPMKRKHTDETRVTLTLEQLKRLINEIL